MISVNRSALRQIVCFLYFFSIIPFDPETAGYEQNGFQDWTCKFEVLAFIPVIEIWFKLTV